MSALARASAIVGSLSVALCCFGALSGPIAVFLGVLALDRIRNSGGTLRGRKAAWGGIATGTAGVFLAFLVQWGISSLQASLNSQMDAAVRATFAAVDEAGRRQALANWSLLSGPTDAGAQVESFAREAKERYGAFTGYSVSSEVQKPDFLGGVHTIELAVDYEFAESRVPGVLVARLVPSAGQWMPVVLIDSMRIEDADRGTLALGVRAPAAKTDAPANPAQEPDTTRAETAP